MNQLKKTQPCEVRIIAGRLRGRKLHFPDLPFLRPTGDRIRETLFNWLQMMISGKHCLDLFAGSGALGFEALSRGAASVIFCDAHHSITDYLQQTIQEWQLQSQAEVFNLTIPTEHQPFQKQFDIVFLDPPFHQNLIAPCCDWLEKNNLLKSGSYIYIEAEASLTTLPVPEHWQLFRSRKAGQVGYYLFMESK